METEATESRQANCGTGRGAHLPKTPGQPRVPGSGRKKGTPNRKVLAAKELVSSLVLDVRYQAKLRTDFVRRRLHPSIEAMLWNYHLGKPRENVTLTGELTINQRLQAEREVIRASFDVETIELLAAESQAMIDRALAVARGLPPAQTPQDVVVDGEAQEIPPETLGKMGGSDNKRYVAYENPPQTTE